MDISVIWYILLPFLDYFSFSADRFMVSVNKFREEFKKKKKSMSMLRMNENSR